MKKEAPKPHIYLDIMVQKYDVHRLNNDYDVHIGEKGTGIVSGATEKYRERMFGKEGIHLELTCFQEGCSGGMQVEHRPRMKAWEVTTYFKDEERFISKDIFYVRYGLDGKLEYAIINTESPGAPPTLGTINGDGLALLEEASPYSPEPLDHTRLTLSPQQDSDGYVSYRPTFYTKESPWDEATISDDAWYRDAAVRVEHDGRVLTIDWTHPEYIEVTASLPENITKYGKFPKQLNPNDIRVFSEHLDEAQFPINQFSWQVWWENTLAGRRGFSTY